jgi:D-3-phosphoglycerate dehydrogenase
MSLEFCEKVWLDQLFSGVFVVLTFDIVNEILGDHNVDKQMTDSRGDVCHDTPIRSFKYCDAKFVQVAYLMADISNVDNATIKELYERLESLSCMCYL